MNCRTAYLLIFALAASLADGAHLTYDEAAHTGSPSAQKMPGIVSAIEEFIAQEGERLNTFRVFLLTEENGAGNYSVYPVHSVTLPKGTFSSSENYVDKSVDASVTLQITKLSDDKVLVKGKLSYGMPEEDTGNGSRGKVNAVANINRTFHKDVLVLLTSGEAIINGTSLGRHTLVACWN